MKLNVPMQLGLWEDDLLEEPASAVSAVFYFRDPLTAAVSPLKAPSPSSSASSSDQVCREPSASPADEVPFESPVRPTASFGQDECHPASGLPWFRHPQAHREIRLGKAVVAYEIKRARRSSIGMIVGVDGLSVRAPRWVSSHDIEAALRAKERWICNKLVEQRERARRQLSARIEWREGASVPFMGEQVVLVLDPRVSGAVLHRADRVDPALPGVAQHILHLGLPQGADPEQIRDAVQSWLQREALTVFIARVEHYAEQLDVSVTKVRLSSAKTRWGSASADGSIRLHWRLVHFSLNIIDYVVAHELAHLREMNHSPRFWDVVRSVMPEFDGPRDALRHVVIPD